ncbi:MAG TPA: TIM barrel protein [Phycisphaerae bacterium]|nr:TIM barrel protein [Phycisphaerae bacterium]
MIKTGLVSITFRKLAADEIVSLVCEAGLDGIEWGGDVHVPHGDIATAERVRDITIAAGLEVAAYGSYYHVGDDVSPKFDDVLASALALGADKIRVWAGRGSDVVSRDERKRTIDDAKRIADLAGEKGITLVSEWHGGTLTDTLESAKSFLADVGRSNFKTYWQPPVGRPQDVCLNEIKEILPYIAGMHVFSWEETKRLPLEQHRDRWEEYLALGASAGDFYGLIEFVQDDSPQVFLRDADVLKKMTAKTE